MNDIKTTAKDFDLINKSYETYEKNFLDYLKSNPTWFHGLVDDHSEIGFTIFSHLGKDVFAYILEPNMEMHKYKNALKPGVVLKKEIESWLDKNYPPIEQPDGKFKPNPDQPFTVMGNGYGDKVIVRKK